MARRERREGRGTGVKSRTSVFGTRQTAIVRKVKVKRRQINKPNKHAVNWSRAGVECSGVWSGEGGEGEMCQVVGSRWWAPLGPVARGAVY